MNNKLIDHTLLKAFATSDEVIELCKEAKEYSFKSVCVNPAHVASAKSFLSGSGVLVCTVIGFPLGANTIETKVFETLDAVKNGADEIDMVINIGKAKTQDYDYLKNEIKAVVEASGGRCVKVILETAYLTDEEIISVSKVSEEAGANFVKTSTGFASRGASIQDIKLMKSAISEKMGIKASGGVKTKEDLEKFVAAGATRIGTSSGKNLI
jgi:deoxyribose-phosphate aldolase